MSLLWKKEKRLQPKIIRKRPSPKHNDHILSFAQSLNSSQGRKTPFLLKRFCTIKGISLFASKGPTAAASMTVEAAIVLPLFLFFFLNLMSSIEMLRLHGNLQLALWETGNRMSVYGSVLSDPNAVEELQKNESAEQKSVAENQSQNFSEEKESLWKELAGVVWSYTYVKSQITEYLGRDYLEQSPLSQGVDSLQFLESNVFENKDCFEVVVTYSVSPLCSIAGFYPFRMANRYYGHLWNGYELSEEEEVFVFVAENGEVYHVDRECTHLKLSVRQVTWQQACNSKNEQGKKYVACEKCSRTGTADVVYITDEGACYHFAATCSGLKRTVACVPLSEVGNLRQCQRCGQSQ